MLVRTIQDVKEALSKIQNGEISADNITFSDFIEDRIKINTASWGNAKTINYKTAQYILAVQKDFLRAYNYICGTSITLAKLHEHEYLIVYFTLEDGCITVICKTSIIFFREVLKNMNPAQKTIVISLICMAIISPFAYFSLDILAKAGVIGDSKIQFMKINAEKQAPRVLINNIGNGTVNYHDGPDMDKEALEKQIPARPVEQKEPFDIDNRYIVLRYDYDKQQVYLSNPQCDSFWASTELLTYEKRDTLKRLSDMAIDTGNAQAADLLITAHVDNGKIKNAKIIGINLPQREGVKPLKEVLKKNSKHKRDTSSPQQGSLLE